MGTSSLLCQSKAISVGLTAINDQRFSLRHSNKHLRCNVSNNAKALYDNHIYKPIKVSSISPFFSRGYVLKPISCSFSSSTVNPDSQNPLLESFRNLSFRSIKEAIFKLTPFDVVKLSAVLSISVAATKWTVNLILNPFFWMYFSWTWLFWPWFAAIALACYGLYCFRKHEIGESKIFEQIAIITSAFTWLTLVPAAHFNGYLEGWPFVFFFIYHYFFFLNVSVRKRLYGDYYARSHDPKWDINTPKWHRILFCIGVMVGHWLAALEGPELHRLPGGLTNFGIWILIVCTILMQYNSTLYLAKYSEKVVEPTAVVQFGPYRWVRHPIYASTMLLFVTNCIALRAPFSLLFVVAVCLMYYEQKARLEEALMFETFGESYLEYASKVKYKFIPFVY